MIKINDSKHLKALLAICFLLLLPLQLFAKEITVYFYCCPIKPENSDNPLACACA